MQGSQSDKDNLTIILTGGDSVSTGARGAIVSIGKNQLN